MNVTIKPTKTGALIIAEALEREVCREHMAADGFPTPRGQFLMDIAHQIRNQSGNEPAPLPVKQADGSWMVCRHDADRVDGACTRCGGSVQS